MAHVLHEVVFWVGVVTLVAAGLGLAVYFAGMSVLRSLFL